MKKNVLNIFFVLCGLFFSASSVCAFSITPIKNEISLNPGDSKSLEVNIKNDSTEKMVFEVSVVGVKQNKDGAPIFEKNINIAEDWATPRIPTIELLPGENQDVFFDLQVPQYAQPNAYYLGFLVKSLGMENEASSASLRGSLASLLYLQVAGEVTEKIDLVSFTVDKKHIWSSRWGINLEVKNNGNISVDSSGTLSIVGGNKKFLEQSFDMGNTILPKSIRAVNSEVNVGKLSVWPKIYDVDVRVLFGRGGGELSAFARVWFIPIWFLISSLAVLILLIFFFFFRKRRVR